MQRIHVVSWALALLVIPVPTRGQAVNGALVGTVLDSTGAVVPNAKVDLTAVNTGISRSANTNQSGNYAFTNLEPGVYRVTVEQTGFRKVVQERIDIVVNATVRVDLTLQPGAISEVVNVTAEAGLLQTDRSDTGRKIETRQLADLPLGYNRNFQSLLNLVPGATRSWRPHSEFFNSQDSLSTRVNGQSRLSNNVQLEGIDNNHRTGLLTALIPPIEALQAVDVTTSNYEAELGRAGGAVTNVIFKSGTNDLHGSVFHFNRVSALGARSFFATRKPVTTYNLFGFTIGGPIKRNRLFFFGDYQGVRDRRGDNHRGTIPQMPMRRGDLSSGPTEVFDPASGDANGFGRTAFPGRIIPASRISPIASRLLALIPEPQFPNQFSNNFEINTSRKKDTNAYDLKGDGVVTDNTRVSLRYSYQRPTVFDPPLYGVAGGGFRDFAGTGIQRTQNVALNITRTFTPTLIAEIRGGFLYYRNTAENADIDLRTATEIGIPGVNVSRFTGGISNIIINGFSNPVIGYSPSLPWDRGETNLNFVVNVTKIRGNHTVKVGVDYRRNRDELLQNQTFSPRGRFNFTEGTTQFRGGPGQTNSPISYNNSFASFLLDQPNLLGRDLPLIFPTFLVKPLFTYIHDKWVVNQRLTVDMGLRHEYWPPAVPRKPGGFSNYDPSDNTLRVAGVGQIPMNLGRRTFYGNFAPRLGLAYRLNERMVFRAGYGISWVPLVDNGYAFNFPVRENNAFNAANAFVPAGSMRTGFPAFVPFPVPSTGIIPNAPASVFNVIPLDTREGYVQSWNAAVQRSIGKFTVEAAYVGNRGVRIMATQNLNAGLIPGAGANGQPLNLRFGRRADTNNIYFGTGTSYHSLQAKFDRRFANGFQMTTAYTWSKAIDQSGADNGGLWVYINPERGRAVADGHRFHVFTQSYIYELPFGRGKAMWSSGPLAVITGGWQVNGLLTLMTGEPFNVTVPAAIIDAPGNTNTANFNGNFRKLKNVGPGTTWFDTSSFSPPADRTFGTLGRNRLTGPGFFHLDFSVFRKFRIREQMNLEFRFESFNFTNTPKFNNPNGNIASPDFGRVLGVNGEPNGPRQIQFGLKLVF